MTLDFQDIQDILRLLDDSLYDALELRSGTFQLSLRRQGEGWTQETRTLAPGAAGGSSPGSTGEAGGVDGAEEAREAGAAEAAPEAPAAETALHEVRAPLPGTFYRAPQPGAAPFVAVGDSVEESTAIGIIEVMKLMSTIPAAQRGIVAEILVDDGRSVEKGQVLLRLRPASSV